MTRRYLLLRLAATGAALLTALPLEAQVRRGRGDRPGGQERGGERRGEERAGETYQIEVWAIRATRSNSEISPDLRRIADELKDRFKYSGFKLEDKSGAKVAEGKAMRAKLPSGYEVKITPEGKKDGRITLKVQAERGGKELAGTRIRIGAGKGHLMGGWKWGEKDDVMILMIRAR